MSKNDNRYRFKATVLAAALAAFPLASHAAGLGKITVKSALGQPLMAELEVTATKDELPSLVARVASADAFRVAGIEYANVMPSLKFSRTVKERNGKQYVELTTDRPLNEPFVDVLVELAWSSGRLVREYTFLLDPPELMPQTPPPAVTAPEAGGLTPATQLSTPPAQTSAMPSPPASGVVRPATDKVPAKPPETPMAAKPGVQAGTRKVLAGDTLGKIASETRSEGVSLDQMLVAIQRANPDAFDDGNMNRLKAGKILAIPDAAAVSQVSSGEARQEVIAQAANFNAYRKSLAEAATKTPVKDQPFKQASSGKIVPKVEDKAPPVAQGKDKLQVSRTDASKEAQNAALRGRVSSLEEDLVSRGKALKESESRIAALENNLKELKKLAEMKSQAGADLQKQAQQKAGEAPKPAAGAKPAEVPKAAEPPKPVEIAKPADAAKPAETPKPAESATPPETPKPAEAPKPAQPPKPPVAKKAPPPPPPEPTFMEEYGGLLMIGGGALAAVLGGLGFTAWRRKRAAENFASEPIAESDLSASSVFGSTSIAPPPSEQDSSQFSATNVSMAAAETMDPLTEADTFLAFGRDAQAEEILLDARKNDPTRVAIHLKLLDIYHARKNLSQFGAAAKEFHALTNGQGADWQKVALMGADLDPDNELYGAKKPERVEPSVPPANAMSTLVMQASPAAEPEPAPEPVVDIAAESGDGSVLDFDIDLGATEAPVAATTAVSGDAAALDIDFNLPEPAGKAADNAVDVPLDVSLDISSDAAEPAGKGGLDFDFNLEAPPVQTEAPVASAALDLNAPLDMSLDLPLDLPGAGPAAAPAPALDLGSISLELDTPVAAPAESAPTEAPSAEGDSSAAATKLELAIAYEEMGDREGARELFQEVLREGNSEQQATAQAKLDALG